MTCALAKNTGRSGLPFDLYSAPPIGRGAGFHLLRDPIGDIVGSLPWQTCDHAVEEQLAYAMLFRASPALLAGAKAALPIVTRELDVMLASFCERGADGKPDLGTLEADVAALVQEMVAAQEQLVAAITLAEGAA